MKEKHGILRICCRILAKSKTIEKFLLEVFGHSDLPLSNHENCHVIFKSQQHFKKQRVLLRIQCCMIFLIKTTKQFDPREFQKAFYTFYPAFLTIITLKIAGKRMIGLR